MALQRDASGLFPRLLPAYLSVVDQDVVTLPRRSELFGDQDPKPCLLQKVDQFIPFSAVSKSPIPALNPIWEPLPNLLQDMLSTLKPTHETSR